MSDAPHVSNEISRITCHVHHRLSHLVNERLVEIGASSILVESGRSVRQLRRPRPFGLPGKIVRLEDQPVEVFRVTAPRERAHSIMEAVIASADLDQPGRGTVYLQDLVEFRRAAADTHSGDRAQSSRPVIGTGATPAAGALNQPNRPVPTLLRDLALITCILSMPGGGQQLARVALDLGTCVPVVTLGTGTGMRDRLGLLRITVPPEKEIVHLIVPAHDCEEIIRILIEEANLNQPGRGFVYQTPVSAGVIDTRLRIGPQEHAASIEQIIAAIDELKGSTAWRKRFVGIEGDETDATLRLLRNNREITLICAEGRAATLVETAIEAGAGGATTSRARRLSSDGPEGGLAARERSTISVQADICKNVVSALLEADSGNEGDADRVQVLEAPAAFTHGT